MELCVVWRVAQHQKDPVGNQDMVRYACSLGHFLSPPRVAIIIFTEIVMNG